MPRVNQLLAVSTFMVMLPAISYCHALVHLSRGTGGAGVGCGTVGAHRVQIPGLRTTVLLFVPLLVPFTVLTFPQVFLFCGLVQALVLILLFLCSLQYRFELAEAAPVL